MATTAAQLIAPQQVAGTATIYYTSGSGVKTRIDKLSVTNPTAGAVSITIHIVPSGGSVGDSTTITKTRGVNTLETWNCPDLVGHVLNPGDTIRALASAATSLTLMASGAQTS